MIQKEKSSGGFLIHGMILLVLLALVTIPAFAQAPTATIFGTVKDASGGTVAGATVTVMNVDTGLSRTQPTGDDGAYRFPALPVGNYEVQVMKTGFEAFDRKGITLVVGQEAAINITLQIGSTGQTVTVTGEAPQVNTTSSTTGGVVTDQEVTDLPLNGRNLVDLTLLQAGVVQSNVFSLTDTIGPTNIVGTTFSSNGAPIHSNNFILDGAIQTNIMNMNASSIIGTTLGVDGVKEYKVVSSLPDASYGLVMGATSTTVSKGGTNQFHGDAFEYLRNSAMDARNYFDALDTVNFWGDGTDKSAVFPGKRIPPFQRNNFGGSFGGPIRKDKTFFYAVYEGLSQNQGATIATNTLPGACYDQTVGSPTYHQVTGASFATAGCSGIPAASQDPATMHFVEDNIFPGQNGVGLFPYPNTNISSNGTQLPGTTFNYSFPYVQPSREHYGQMRVDQNISQNDTFFARYTQDDSNQIAPGNYPQIHDYQASANQFITLSENHIFSPTVLNTARFSFQRTLSVANISPSPNVTDPNVIMAPAASQSFQVFDNGFTPSSSVTNFAASGGADGTLIQNIYSYSDDIYWTKGKHAFKFGAVLNQYQDSQNTVFQQGSIASFANLTQFANGIYTGITTTAGTEYPYDERYYLYSDIGFYAQDDVRATSKLTLNLGLRYEFATVPREANGQDYNIPDIATANGASANQGAVPDRMFQNMSLHNFSPRIGFAYDPTGKGTTSIRGEAGIYYDIATYGSPMLEEACCQSPTAYAIFLTNNSQSTVPVPFAIPLPTAQVGPGSAGDNGILYGGNSVKTAVALPSPRNVDYYLKQPSMLQYNLTIDHQLPFGTAVSVGFVGSRGWHLPVNVEANFMQPLGTLPNGLPYFCEAAVNPAIDPTCAQSTNPASPYYLSRVNPTLGPVSQYTDRSDSWYNSLQVNVNKRVTHGLQFTEALTWGKLLDDGQSQQPGEANSIHISDPTDPALDRGLSGYDAAFNSRFNVIYNAPSFKSDKFYAKPFNGWWFSSIWSAQSGYPFEPTISVNRDFTANQSDVVRPDLSSTFNPSTVIVGSPSQWFNPTMYSIQPVGTYGDSPRDGLRAPGLQDVDFSIVKDTRAGFLGEAGNIEFRAEVFNILNHPNFGLPNATVWAPSSAGVVPTFNGVYDPQILPAGTIDPATGKAGVTDAFSKAGQITNTNNRSRQIQIALKVIF